MTNPAMAEYMRNLRWNPHSQAPRHTGDSNNTPLLKGGYRGVAYYDPFVVTPADEETDYEYDQENRLVEVTLPSGVEVEFYYDGMGRRLSKVITDDTGDDTLITTWKYHYIGGQITTIEVDAVEVDDSEPPVETAVRDETLRIHLGPNGQPLSFEWVRYDYTTMSCPPFEGGTQGGCREPSSGNSPSSAHSQSSTATTLSDTYYYHYDIHGNVIKVTDSSATTKISYEYDVLGEITSVSNPDGITNPFTWGGASQLIFDDVLHVYSNRAGSYMPDTGTLLGGGAPVFVNPTSGHVVSKMAINSLPQKQTKGHKFQALGSDLATNGVSGGIVDAIDIIGIIVSLYNMVVDHVEFSKNTYYQNYDLCTGGFTGIRILLRIKINSLGLRALINCHSDYGKDVAEDGWIYAEDCYKMNLDKYGGGTIPLMNYLDVLTRNCLKLADKIVGDGSVGISGDCTETQLAYTIFNAMAEFDALNGGAGAYSSSDNAESFFTYLVNKIREAGFSVTAEEFLETYMSYFGYDKDDLPDSDNDGKCDVIDFDDDNDGIMDVDDDDDDGDGIPDWEEEDGNAGGDTEDRAGDDDDDDPPDENDPFSTQPTPEAGTGPNIGSGLWSNTARAIDPTTGKQKGGRTRSIIPGRKRNTAKHKATPLGKRFQEEKWIPWKGWRGDDFWPIPPPSYNPWFW